MAAMPRDPQTDSDWASEAQEQEKIAAQIESDAPVKDFPKVAGTDAQHETQQDVDAGQDVEEAPKVTLRAVADDIDYPMYLSVVGAAESAAADEDGYLVFESQGAEVEVAPQVAENVLYRTDVEVVA